MKTKKHHEYKDKLDAIETEILEVKTMLREFNNYMGDRLHKLNSIDSKITLLEQQVCDIRRLVKYLNEQSNKD
ncbi:hypothetical protein Q4E93_10045 [Flavitalea sp. BT771]|uniref:hypothetical protein n=1 Tax=Flavitalea sp. BT771 TaxID=3063329 RepID=UPI0026E454F7|nr:hypothetical protein [Flavitalea sp. BT771]MDO6430929.1 hypothetical protein [Flavitalea sp. BT771]MDV6218931.1 hypothetical protein [Flavitalea sp. BT771]